MSKVIGILLAAVIIIGAGLYLMRKDAVEDVTYQSTSATTTEQQQQQNVAAQGRAVFSVTDAAANMSTISEITLQVRSVEVRSATTGWTVISTTPRTYNLLALNASNKSEILADVNINAGTYDQVRLMVDSVVVKTKAGATKTAKLPSGELKINTIFVVNADRTASLNFDFLADKSLHLTGNGEYIFAPVIKTESKSNADVTVNGDNSVIIIGGQSNSSGTAGMDIDGTLKADFQINSKQKLNVDSNNVIKLDGALIN